MSGIRNGRSVTTFLAAVLVIFAVAIPGEAKGKNKCEGTKKERKQKMAPRTINDDQLLVILESYAKDRAADRERMIETVVSRLEREYNLHKYGGADFTYDILVISGGGEKGAFGSGFLDGWGSVPSGPFARPEFDMVTGVSTGALISPFAFIGTDESYSSIVDFYANPEANWVKKRGALYFKPGHVSLFNDCHLQEMIRARIDESLIKQIAAASKEDKLLLIGTTNLDAGRGRIFDLGHEAETALESGLYDRIATILIASAAIPAIFPPVEIDGLYYADGGATSNLFITGFPAADGPVARFKERNPGAPTPKVRVWIQINGKIRSEPAVTQPTWPSVAGRSLGTLMASEEIFALNLIRLMVEDVKTERGLDAEYRIVSIPPDTPPSTSKEMFDKEYMLGLEELGRTMGADPSSWTTEIPAAY